MLFIPFVTAWCLSLAVASATGTRSILVSLYNLQRTNAEQNRELRLDQMVNVTMSCFDLTNSSDTDTSNSLFKFDVNAGVEDDRDYVDDHRSANETIVRLPERVAFVDDSSSLSTSDKMYHVRHLMSLGRMLAGGGIHGRNGVVFDDVLVKVKLVKGFDELATGPELRLIRMKDYCRALLSDYDCTYNRIASYLPHSLEEIKTCVDIWLHNSVMFHSFFNLQDAQLNASTIASDCFADALMLGAVGERSRDTVVTMGAVRTIKCFHTNEDDNDDNDDERRTAAASPSSVALAINVKKYYESLHDPKNATMDAFTSMRSSSTRNYLIQSLLYMIIFVTYENLCTP